MNSPSACPLRARPPSRTGVRIRGLVLGMLALGAGAGVGPFTTPVVAADDACRDAILKAGLAIQALERTGDPEKGHEALGLLDRARRRCPDDPEIPFRAGLANVLLGDLDAVNMAIRTVKGLALSRATQLNRPATEAENDSRALYLEALVSKRFGSRPGDAVATLVRLRALDPAFLPDAVTDLLYRSHLDYAVQLMSSATSREGEEAILALKEAALAEAVAARLDPRKRDVARHRHAQVLSWAHRWPEAQEILEDLVKRYPLDAHARFDLSTAYATQARYEAAIASWSETLRLLALPDVDPRLVELLSDARMRLGVCMFLSGDAPAGIGELKRHLESRPNDARAWSHLGRAYVSDDSADRSDEAIAAFERAHALDPFCEAPLRELLKLYETVRLQPARAKEIIALLEGEKEPRKREMLRRERTRPDKTNGCE